jgi:DNA repair protein RecN (Recombination protein N)
MLLELRIGNLALVEDVTLPFGPGLTVLTGETGAGKSLVAGALGLLHGGRGDRERIRRGEDTAWVEAVCDLSGRDDLCELVRELGLPLGGDGLLVLRRELRREGRGRVVVNGTVSSLAVLERLGPRLFAIQSQDQQRELARPGYARDLLDTALDLGDARQEVARALAGLRDAQDALAELVAEHEAAREQADLWRYQLEELGAAGLQAGEEEELAEAIAVKRHAQALTGAAAAAREALESGPAPARETLGAALAALARHADKSPRLQQALEHVQTAADLAAEASTELDRFLDGFATDPRGLDELEQRKALYEELRRKYRRDVPELLALANGLARRVQGLTAADDAREAHEAAVEAARTRLAGRCEALREARREGAARVAAEAEALIQPLALPDLRLRLAVAPAADEAGEIALEGTRCRVSAHGADEVTLRVQTNPGESEGDVAAVASGGEVSRIHLGLSVLRRAGTRPLLQLFDEVDAGLGMDAAGPVAALLRRLAREGQALCITHLPTVAVHGADHWVVRKRVAGGRTTLAVTRVEGEDRIAEVARQLGGEGWRRSDEAAQLAYARELLEAARRTGASGAGALRARRSSGLA